MPRISIITGIAGVLATVAYIGKQKLDKHHLRKAKEHWEEINKTQFLIADSPELKTRENKAVERFHILKSLAYKDGTCDEREWCFLAMCLIQDKDISTSRKIDELSQLSIPERTSVFQALFKGNPNDYFDSEDEKFIFARKMHILAAIDERVAKEESEFIHKTMEQLRLSEEELNIDQVHTLLAAHQQG